MADAISDAELREEAQRLLEGKAKALLESNTLTLRVLRKLLEEQLSLSEGALDSRKATIALIVKEALNLEPQDAEAANSTEAAKQLRHATAAAERKAGASIEKENRKPPKAGGASAAKGKRKKSEDGATARGAKGKSKVQKCDKRTTRTESDGEADADREEEQSQRPKKKARSQRNSQHSAEGAGGGKTKSAASKTIEKLKDVCKKATIKIAPTMYVRNKAVSELEAALAELLARHGLNAHSGDKEIGQVRRQLERDRDLEGIDTSNIISLGGGRPRRAAAAAVDFRNMFKQPKIHSEDDDSEEERSAARKSSLGASGKGTQHGDDSSEGDDHDGSERRQSSNSDASGDDTALPAAVQDKDDGVAIKAGSAGEQRAGDSSHDGESDTSPSESEDLVQVTGGSGRQHRRARAAQIKEDEDESGGSDDGAAATKDRCGGKGKLARARLDKGKDSGSEDEQEKTVPAVAPCKTKLAAVRKARRVVVEEGGSSSEEEEEESSSDDVPDDDSDFEADDSDD